MKREPIKVLRAPLWRHFNHAYELFQDTAGLQAKACIPRYVQSWSRTILTIHHTSKPNRTRLHFIHLFPQSALILTWFPNPGRTASFDISAPPQIVPITLIAQKLILMVTPYKIKHLPAVMVGAVERHSPMAGRWIKRWFASFRVADYKHSVLCPASLSKRRIKLHHVTYGFIMQIAY